MKYYFAIDNSGRILKGCAVHTFEEPMEDCIIEEDEQVWLNQNRAFYSITTGKWVIYSPIILTVPTSVTVNVPITVTATLPTGSPDTEIKLCVAWQDVSGELHRADPMTVSVVDGQASMDIQFSTAGRYLIEAFSEHHGLTNAEVVVS